MRRAPAIVLETNTREELERLARSRSQSVRLAQRSRIILLAAAGLDNDAIGVVLNITRQKVGRWRIRFAERSMEGILQEEHRSYRPPLIRPRMPAHIAL